MSLDHPFTREEIVARLRATIAEGRPVIGAGSSAGIVAKSAEHGGADLIIVYSTGKSRLMGLPTTEIGDSNALTLEMFEEIENVVQDTPIVGGALATDPRTSVAKLLGKFQAVGYSGVINFPNVSLWGDEIAGMKDDAGIGYSREVEMIRLARSQDFFTMAYVYTPTQAQRMAAAGVDVQVPHVGWTTGGLVGRSTSGAPSFEQAAEMVRDMVDATWAENPDCICLAHGGPYDTPESTATLYRDTDVHGFVGASSIERIPIERAVREAVEAFKAAGVPRAAKAAGAQ